MEESDIFILKSIFNYFLYSKDPNKYIYGLKSIKKKNQTSIQIQKIKHQLKSIYSGKIKEKKNPSGAPLKWN
jgi:hypothetical protein